MGMLRRLLEWIFLSYWVIFLLQDLLMDWSVLRIHSLHPLLRPELVYTNNIPVSFPRKFSCVLMDICSQNVSQSDVLLCNRMYSGLIPHRYSIYNLNAHRQVTNILIRFIWVIYIPKNGPSMMLRSFIAGMLEMLRRIQWNFCAS